MRLESDFPGYITRYSFLNISKGGNRNYSFQDFDVKLDAAQSPPMKHSGALAKCIFAAMLPSNVALAYAASRR
jgi:hypothetical protein